MRPEYYIQSGQVITQTSDNPPNGLFSLVKFFKKVASWFHIPLVDDCCTADQTNLPVRYNATAGHVQYYNPNTQLWVNVPSL